MPTTTVRLNQESLAALRQLATEEGEPMQQTLAKAIEAYRRKRFIQRGNEQYAALRADPKAWAEEMEERKLWEGTLGDGLGDE